METMMITTSIRLNGLTCPACKKLTEKRLSALAGVKSVAVDYVTGMAEITADREISAQEINNSLQNTSFSVDG
jgi:copper chaperone CopZ